MKIVTYGNPVLRAKGKHIDTITDDIRTLVADMEEAMHRADGVGLAAHQVGQPLQLAIVDIADAGERPSTLRINDQEVDIADWMPLVVVNPTLDLGAEKELGPEGCLSFPDITADIPRSITVRGHTQLIDGRHIQFEASGFLARALQHEIDHLNGILFVDRANSAAKASLASKLKRLQRDNAG